MRKLLKNFWNYLRFLVWDDDLSRVDRLVGEIKKTAIAVVPKEELLGMELKADERMPKDHVAIVGAHNAAVVNTNTGAIHDIIFDYVEGSGEAKIMSISLWSQGRKCDHSYRKAVSSKEHDRAVKAQGVHRDYICSKCGHTICTIVSPDAKSLSTEWGAILSEPNGD